MERIDSLTADLESSNQRCAITHSLRAYQYRCYTESKPAALLAKVETRSLVLHVVECLVALSPGLDEAEETCITALACIVGEDDVGVDVHLGWVADETCVVDGE